MTNRHRSPVRRAAFAPRACLASFAFAACLALSPTASAQSSAAAEALFNEGKAAMGNKDFDTACQRFRASNQLDPAVGTLLNLAVCEGQRGRLATAWELYRGVYEKLPPADPRRDYVQTQLSQIEPRLPKVLLKLAADAPQDTKVKDGETEYSSAAFGVSLPMDPGAHHFVVEAAGREPRAIDVTLAEATNEVVEIAPGPPVAANATPKGEASPQETPLPDGGVAKKSGRDTRMIGFIAGGVGVVGVGVGITTGLMALGKKSITDDECSSKVERCTQKGKDAADAGRTLATVSTVGWVVGVLGLGAGAYFVLTSDSGSGTEVATEVVPGGAGLRFSKAF